MCRSRTSITGAPAGAGEVRGVRTHAGDGDLDLLHLTDMAWHDCYGPRELEIPEAVLDEIAGGLTEGECLALVDTIKAIGASGITIVWIEHIVHALLSVADRIVAINFGRKLIEGDPRTVMASPEVRDVYLGVEAV